jgi:hypothetical protein
VAALTPALLALLIAGCATRECPRLAPEVTYCLQPPASAPRITVLQEVVVTRERRADTLLVQAENDGLRLAVVGISPLGQTLVSAVWDGITVRAQPAMPSFAPDAGAMLAFVQFGLLPFDALMAGISPDVVRGREVADDGAILRFRDANGRLLMEIRREGRGAPSARTRVQLPTAGLAVDSRALEPSPAAPAAP